MMIKGTKATLIINNLKKKIIIIIVGNPIVMN